LLDLEGVKGIHERGASCTDTFLTHVDFIREVLAFLLLLSLASPAATTAASSNRAQLINTESEAKSGRGEVLLFRAGTYRYPWLARCMRNPRVKWHASPSEPKARVGIVAMRVDVQPRARKRASLIAPQTLPLKIKIANRQSVDRVNFVFQIC
jgi:hypothetical protein